MRTLEEMGMTIKTIKEWADANAAYSKWKDILSGAPIEKSKILAVKLEEMKKMLEEGAYFVADLEKLIFHIVGRTFLKHDYLIKSCKDTYECCRVYLHILDGYRSSDVYSDPELSYCIFMAQKIAELKL